jgi:hypothetical protein
MAALSVPVGVIYDDAVLERYGRERGTLEAAANRPA